MNKLSRSHLVQSVLRTTVLASALILSTSLMNLATAQEVRYSWFEIGYMGQDVSKNGSSFDLLLNQSVDIRTLDGSGVRFGGSVGTWNNLYAIFDFATADPDVNALVTNPQGMFPGQDEFDLTTVRAGVGFKYTMGLSHDLFGEITFDSVSFDFGSFAGEDFDVNERDIGARLGIRSMFGDDLELRAYGRYTNVGDVNLTNKSFESDVLFGAGFGYTIMQGLSITGEYESGVIETWSIGFRLDMDED